MKHVRLEGDVWRRFECKKCSSEKCDCKTRCNCHRKCNCRKSCNCQRCIGKCDYPYLEEVRDLIESIKNYIFSKGVAYAQYLDYGYKETRLDKMEDLSIYLDVLTSLYDNLYRHSKGFESDLYYCPEDFKNIKSEVISIIGIVKIEHYDHFFDDSGINQYMISNPNEISFERWKKHLYNFETQYEIKVEKINSEPCLEVVYGALKADKGNCKVLYQSLKDVASRCDTRFSASFDEGKCKVDYSVLIKTDFCKGIKYDVFSTAIKCGFTAKAIKSIYKCGGQIKASKNNDKCFVSFNGSPYVECNSKNLNVIINKIQCADIN